MMHNEKLNVEDEDKYYKDWDEAFKGKFSTFDIMYLNQKYCIAVVQKDVKEVSLVFGEKKLSEVSFEERFTIHDYNMFQSVCIFSRELRDILQFIDKNS